MQESPEKFQLLRAVKMWYSSTRSHMGQQATAQGAFAGVLFLGHTKAPFLTVISHYTMKGDEKSIEPGKFPKNFRWPNQRKAGFGGCRKKTIDRFFKMTYAIRKMKSKCVSPIGGIKGIRCKSEANPSL